MSQASRHVKQKTAAINAGIESGISGIRTAKAFANEAEELEKFNVSNDVYKTSKKEFHKAMGRFNARDGVLPVHSLRGGDRRRRRPHYAGAS